MRSSSAVDMDYEKCIRFKEFLEKEAVPRVSLATRGRGEWAEVFSRWASYLVDNLPEAVKCLQYLSVAADILRGRLEDRKAEAVVDTLYTRFRECLEETYSYCREALAGKVETGRLGHEEFQVLDEVLYEIDTVRRRALDRDFTGLQLWVRGAINMIRHGLPKARHCVHIAEALLEFLEKEDIPEDKRAEKTAQLTTTLMACLLDSYPEYKDILAKAYMVK